MTSSDSTERVALAFLSHWYDWAGDPEPWWRGLYDDDQRRALKAAEAALEALTRTDNDAGLVEALELIARDDFGLSGDVARAALAKHSNAKGGSHE